MKFSSTVVENKRKAQSCVVDETKINLLYVYTCSLSGKSLRLLKFIKAHIFTHFILFEPLIAQ